MKEDAAPHTHPSLCCPSQRKIHSWYLRGVQAARGTVSCRISPLILHKTWEWQHKQLPAWSALPCPAAENVPKQRVKREGRGWTCRRPRFHPYQKSKICLNALNWQDSVRMTECRVITYCTVLNIMGTLSYTPHNTKWIYSNDDWHRKPVFDEGTLL